MSAQKRTKGGGSKGGEGGRATERARGGDFQNNSVEAFFTRQSVS